MTIMGCLCLSIYIYIYILKRCMMIGGTQEVEWIEIHGIYVIIIFGGLFIYLCVTVLILVITMNIEMESSGIFVLVWYYTLSIESDSKKYWRRLISGLNFYKTIFCTFSFSFSIIVRWRNCMYIVCCDGGWRLIWQWDMLIFVKLVVNLILQKKDNSSMHGARYLIK